MIYKQERDALPEIRFVGGETQALSFSFSIDDDDFDVSGCSGLFSIQRPDSHGTSALRSWAMTAETNEDDGTTALNLYLSPADTVDLDGMYIYQITIQDENGAIRIPGHGTLFLHYNLDRGNLTPVHPGDATLIPLTVTANGSYTPGAGVDGYSRVVVNVPSTGIVLTSEDEGKVVADGALAAQTAMTLTANGQYDTTSKNSVTVNVPGQQIGAEDEGKVVSNGSLVTQTTGTVEQNGTYDTTLLRSVTVNVSGGDSGGGGSAAVRTVGDWNVVEVVPLDVETVTSFAYDANDPFRVFTLPEAIDLTAHNYEMEIIAYGASVEGTSGAGIETLFYFTLMNSNDAASGSRLYVLPTEEKDQTNHTYPALTHVRRQNYWLRTFAEAGSSACGYYNDGRHGYVADVGANETDNVVLPSASAGWNKAVYPKLRVTVSPVNDGETWETYGLYFRYRFVSGASEIAIEELPDM